MAPLVRYAGSVLFFAGLCLAGCENPATFKKCLTQSRAEVDICGINMTCKCLRQENVVKCYDKCGDDDHYQKLQEGEKGQQQIYCSQKRAGEPDDLPIIGSDGGSRSEKKKKDTGGKPEGGAAKPAAPPPMAPAPPVGAPVRRPDDDDAMMGGRGRRGDKDGSNSILIRNPEIDAATGLRAAADIGSIAALAAAAGLLWL
ncbi:hypothetical protein GGI07_003148 [Coemansia sp. Benny D115]|nr:hypothetical protein GGI07_003148 [Coemansia sp. Benny D115]